MQVSSLVSRATASTKSRIYGTFYKETSDGNVSLDKWKVALLFGIPVVIGCGCIAYFYFRQPKKQRKSTANAKTEPKTIAETSKDPFTNAMSAKNRGNKYFKCAKYENAIQCYTEAINLCPEHKVEELATFYQNRAASNEALKKYEDVISDCSVAIQLKRDYLKAWQRRSKAYEELGRLPEALNDITAACVLDQFQNQNNIISTDRILRNHSKIKAKEHISTRTPSMPSNHFVRHYFMSYVKHPIIEGTVDGNKLEELLVRLTESGDLVDREEKISLIKGTIQILKGDVRNGETELEKVAKSETCDSSLRVNALIKLGTIKVHDIENTADGIRKSMECFEEALKLDPNNPDIYLHRAQIYLLGEQFDEAKTDLEKCCDLSPNFPSGVAQRLYVHFRCAVRYNDETNVRKVIKEFEEATKKFPNSSELLSLYAQALMEQQKFQEADEFFLKAIQCDPEDANLLVHRAILLIQSTNNLEKALKLLEKALQSDNKCQFAYEMLGTIEVQRGNLQKGIDCFDGALANAQTEIDCAHLYSLREAAMAQSKAIEMLGVQPIMPQF
ncbi:mitochondrial import receptor subunit TOM70-like protein [Leptotrombidium deliense]|uniref:Mitochondrial import receptor subunit TOM70-like protein n=1 Tax=Leptotrombidium deliense TaxID=299467 RepID=A0A443SL93_9ACAR|nr:mitochondrial import receptor subunit TOM70-like protein [Leptotrombidium deliense]